MNRTDFPRIHFYDQDFVDIYDKTWDRVNDYWMSGSGKGDEKYFVYSEDDGDFIEQYPSIFSTFFLVYSNRNYSAEANLDYFYAKQEATGAIRKKYDIKTGKPVLTKANPEGLGIPLFAWAEYNIYHKTGNKKRVKDVLPVLLKYMEWIAELFKEKNGLYKTPLAVTRMVNSPRKSAAFLIDFNSAMAINALYLSALGDILNDKEVSFQYKKLYFTLKTRINDKMWDSDSGFYYDLDVKEQHVPVRTLASYWPLLAEIPNEDKAAQMASYLSDPEIFGGEHPFPSLAANEPEFSDKGGGYCGSVFPDLNYIVIKGLEKYNRWSLARECAIRHIYYVLETLSPTDVDEYNKTERALWEAYNPMKEGKAEWPRHTWFPRKNYILTLALSTISLMIENVIGLNISLPRKTVGWTIPSMEVMGIENLSLKRNLITILSTKSNRGWEIHMESEKLYYFTIDIIGEKRKTLPIPSGKCSMLIDKL
ncbi:MAG: hypothetical protein CR988_03490 [Treponema sp.]|nr:MAG: hypothetical protein CR988_03490 [Treponema sp.]